jgi:hypothetical protein
LNYSNDQDDFFFIFLFFFLQFFHLIYCSIFQKVPDGPELDDFKEKRKEYDRDIGNILATVAGGSSIDPISIEVEEKSVEAILEETTHSIESNYTNPVCLKYINGGKY